MRRAVTKKGSVLILALWTLTFLSIIVVQIGLTIRQRINLLMRLEARSQLRMIAGSGVKKAIAALRYDWEKNPRQMTATGKSYRHNNSQKFGKQKLGNGSFTISYLYIDDNFRRQQVLYGLVDEESKININTAGRNVLMRLLHIVATPNEEEARDIAEAMIAWRELGQTQTTGFYSDEYYSNLLYSYETKNADFELIDELLLIRGMTQEIFDKIKPFVTVYGDGLINMNTAPYEVLLSLGLDPYVVRKILSVRRGNDGIEATLDDFIFQRSYDIAADVIKFVKLEIEELKQIDQLNARGMVKTNSNYYLIQSKGQLEHRPENLEISCVYNLRENMIEYWKEKN